MIRAIFYFDDNSITIHSENTKHVCKEFLNGYYNANLGRNGELIINRVDFKEIHEPYPNQNSAEILDTINKFLLVENRIKCNQMGYTYKMNVLLHGIQGSGKTSVINYICKNLVDHYNAIVFRIDNASSLEASWSLGEEIRKIQSNPLIFIMDEFDQYCTKNSEAYIKSILDGNRSIDNSIILGATNYLDRIPDTIKNRPSRFRIVRKVERISSKDVIRKIISNQNALVKDGFLSEKDIDDIVNSIDAATVDEIKNILLDKLMNLTLDLPERQSIGFSNKNEDDGIDERRLMFDKVLETFKLKQGSIVREVVNPINHESSPNIIHSRPLEESPMKASIHGQLDSFKEWLDSPMKED